jgi:hypothetical protein
MWNDLWDSQLAVLCGQGVHRSHSSANVPAPHTAHASYFANWYATHQYTQVAPHIEEWGPIDYQNPANQLFFPAGLKQNNSRGRPELLSIDLRQTTLNPYKDAAGRVTFSGYSDRYGKIVSGCTAVGLDCVPFKVAGAKAYGYQWSANIGGAGALVDREYDVMSPSTGRSLISFPN